MKALDLEILAHLRQDGRQKLTLLSRKTGVAVSTLHDRMKVMYANKALQHTTLVNFSAVGFAAKAHVFIKVFKPQKQDFEQYLTRHFNVNSLYRINNGYDFLVEAVFKNPKELEDFLDRIEVLYKILKKEVHYIIEDLKREKFLADPGAARLQAEPQDL